MKSGITTLALALALGTPAIAPTASAAEPGTICISGADLGITLGYWCARRPTAAECQTCVRDWCKQHTSDITFAWIVNQIGDVYDSFQATCEAVGLAECHDHDPAPDATSDTASSGR